MALDKDVERLMGSAHSARLIHLNDSVIFPLLHRSISQAVDRMCGDFNSSATVDIKHVAYIVACKTIINELDQLARRGDAAVIKLQQQGVIE